MNKITPRVLVSLTYDLIRYPVHFSKLSYDKATAHFNDQ